MLTWWPNVSNKLPCRSKPGANNEKSSYKAMTHLFYYFGEDQDLMERVLGVNRFKLNRWSRLGYIPVYDAMDIKKAIPEYQKTLKQMCPYVYKNDWSEYVYRYEEQKEIEKQCADEQMPVEIKA